MPSVNWDDVKGLAEDFEPVPASTYDLRIAETRTQSAGTGKDMIVATFEVMSGPHTGRRAWNNFVVPNEDSKPGHATMFLRAMKLLGVDELLTGDTPLDVIADAIVGVEVQAEVTIDYDAPSGPTNRVKVKRNLGSSTPQPQRPRAGVPAVQQQQQQAPALDPEETQTLQQEDVDVKLPASSGNSQPTSTPRVPF